jgi:rubrerythrin
MGLGDSPDPKKPEPQSREERVREARRALPPTGRWACGLCGHEWASSEPTPEGWQELSEGPHVCPSCSSYTYTYPTGADPSPWGGVARYIG